MASMTQAAASPATGAFAAALPRFLAVRPLAVLCLAFIAGAALAGCVPLLPLVLLGVVLIGVAGCLILLRRSRAGALAVAALFLAGVMWRSLAERTPANDVSRFASPSPRSLRGVVASPLKRVGGLCLFTLDVESIFLPPEAARAGGWREVSGKVSVRALGEPTYDHGWRLEVRAPIRAVPAPGEPGSPAYARYLRLQGMRASMTLRPGSVVHAVPPGRAAVGPALDRVRLAIRSRLRETMPGPNATLYSDVVASIVFGVSNAPLPQPIVDDFRRTGTIHVLVVSGAQVSLLAAALVFLCRGRRRHIGLWHVLLILPVLVVFCAVVGYGAPVRRALSVCVLLLLAVVSRRDYDPYTALAVAAFIMLAMDPLSVESVSAQLSFAAAFGVIYFQPRRRAAPDAPPLWKRILAFCLYGSTGAWLMTLPLTAHHFSSFPTLAPLINLLVLPLVAILVPTGMIASLLSFLLPAAAIAVNHLNRVLADLILGCVHFGAGLPFAFERNVHMPAHAVALWYVVLIGGVGLARWRLREHLQPRKLIPAALVVLAVLALWYALSLPPGHLTFTMLDVGDGECLVVQSPSGRTMMIDAGQRTMRGETDVARRVVLPYLMARHIARLDHLVITHPDADHVNALADVLDEVPVGEILEAQMGGSTHAYQRYEQTAEALRIPRHPVRRGHTIDLGRGAVAAVLSPGPVMLPDPEGTANNNSIVLKLLYGDVSFLLTGDLEFEGEEGAMSAPVKLDATILKVGHHGGSAASSPAFLARVHPRVALISCSNAFGLDHPSPEVLGRLRTIGAQVYRTDVHGTITVTTDGHSYRIHPSRPPP